MTSRCTLKMGILYSATALFSILYSLLPTSAGVTRAAQQPACYLGLKAVTGFKLTTVVSGLPHMTAPAVINGVSGGGCIGPFGVAFQGKMMYVAAPFSTGGLYRFPLTGGSVGRSSELNTTHYQGEPVFDRGALYIASPSMSLNAGAIVQLNPAIGAVVHRIASNLTEPQYLAADPLSGDLFYQDGISSGPVTPDIWELSNPSGTHSVVKDYVSGLGALVNGLAFAPNGVLYAADGNGNVYSFPGTRGSAKPKATLVVTLNNPTGIAVGATGAHGQALTLWVATYGGDVDFVNLADTPPTVAQVVTSSTSATGHTMGLNIGTDGCVYISTPDSVMRLARTNGGCAATK